MNTNIKDEPILIGIKEASKLMNMGEKTIRKFTKLKGFPVIILPHKILIDKNQLPLWISRNYGTYKN